MFGAVPPKGLTKDIIARMIAYRIQEEAFGGLDKETGQAPGPIGSRREAERAEPTPQGRHGARP